MRICFVLNNVKTQRATYTTSHLGFSGYRRGHEVAFVSIDQIGRGEDGLVYGDLVRPPARKIRDARAFVKAMAQRAGDAEVGCLNDFDVVFLRYNPNVGPFPMGLHPLIELGRQLRQGGVMVVNDPDGLSRAGSKMYLAGLPAQIRPRTLVTRSEDRVRAFLKELAGPAVIKPLSGFGGQDVFYIERGRQANLSQIVSALSSEGYLMVQEFLPQVVRGDKRVLLLGGSPLRLGHQAAAYLRMKPKDDIRSNIHVGGARRPCTLSDTEEAICDLIRPRLVADGLYFVGVDLVGDKVLEINVFAPGGINNINELYGIDVGAAVIADLERKVSLKRVYRETVPPHVIMRA
jgi:glutathione synthase